jgi:hypothetical protein
MCSRCLVSDQPIGFASHGSKWKVTVRFLRRMALGILGVIVLLWFVDRMELINSYRGIETTRATGLSAVAGSPPLYNAPMLSTRVASNLMLAQAPAVERDRQIARTASLQISVQDFPAARDSMDRIVSAHGGAITFLNISCPKDSARTLSAQLTIPSAQRDAALGDFRKLGRVETENQGSEEVTTPAEDLDIRLKNAREAEERLASILGAGMGKLSDILEVEQEQTRLRGEIETMEAEQRRLKNRVAFVSISLNLTEDYQARLGIHNSLTSLQIRNAFVNGLREAADGLLSVVLALLSAAPSLLLWGLILFWPARWAWRRWRTSRVQATARE